MFFRRIIVRRRVMHPDKARITFRDGQTTRVMGRPFTISVSIAPNAKYATARARDGIVRVKLPEGIRSAQQEKQVSELSRRAISRAILPEVTERVRHFNGLHFNAELGAVRLKDNVSNWGSCSRKNNINLDFRLLFGPQEVMDAVIVHELTHTKHRDHSNEFYGTLLEIMPDNKERLRWLRDNGIKLNSDAPPQELIAPSATESEPVAAKPDLPIWQLPERNR